MLSEFLERIGVRSLDELNAEERRTYQEWSAVLSKPETTIEDLKAFLPKEIERLREELGKYDNSEKRELYFKAALRNMELITKIITTPEKEREQLRAQLQQRFGLQ
jgi:hypothetical protein